jgi:hypothetical protein
LPGVLTRDCPDALLLEGVNDLNQLEASAIPMWRAARSMVEARPRHDRVWRRDAASRRQPLFVALVEPMNDRTAWRRGGRVPSIWPGLQRGSRSAHRADGFIPPSPVISASRRASSPRFASDWKRH